MSGSGSGGKGAKGGNWKNELAVEDGQRISFILTQNSLREQLCRLDHAEQLRKIWLFKRPLKKGQYTQIIYNHQFVVIESIQSYWSLEKNSDRLFVQKNQSFRMVVLYEPEKRPRNRPVVEIKHGDCKGTIRDLIKFLYDKNELQKKYNWIEENCKDFANRVFNEFAVPSTTVYRYWPFDI